MQHSMDANAPAPETYSARVDQSGRIVIPSELRERLHIQPGDELVVREQSGSVTISSYEQVLAEAQSYFTSLVDPGVSVVDELLAERRAEVERELAEAAGNDD